MDLYDWIAFPADQAKPTAVTVLNAKSGAAHHTTLVSQPVDMVDVPAGVAPLAAPVRQRIWHYVTTC